MGTDNIPIGVRRAAERIAEASRDWQSADAEQAIVGIIMAETRIGQVVDSIRHYRRNTALLQSAHFGDIPVEIAEAAVVACSELVNGICDDFLAILNR